MISRVDEGTTQTHSADQSDQAEVTSSNPPSTSSNGIQEDTSSSIEADSPVNASDTVASRDNVDAARTVRFNLTQGYQDVRQQGDPNDPAKTFIIDQPGLSVDDILYTDIREITDTTSPEDATRYVLNARYSESHNQDYSQVAAFSEVLHEKGDDPEYMQNFFQAMGNEESARLLNALSSSDGYVVTHIMGPTVRGIDQEGMQNIQQSVRNMFSEMNERGMLTQNDINNLVGAMTEHGWVNEHFITDIVAELPYQDESLKNMFFNSLVEASGAQSGDQANQLAAAAAHVLSATSMDNQARQLFALKQNGGLDSFIKKAMAGESDVETLGSHINMRTNMALDPVKENFGNVEGLLLNLTYVDVRDPFMPPLGLTTAEVKDLQASVFYAASKALSDSEVNDNLQNRPALKDALAGLFAQHAPDIFKAGVRPGSQAGLTSDAQLALANFARKEFFTPPIGEAQLTAIDAYTNYMNEIFQDLMQSTPGPDSNLLVEGNQPPTMTAAEFEQKWGINRQSAARVLGSMSGVMEMGFRASIEDIKRSVALIDWNNRTWASIGTEGVRRIIQNLAPRLFATNPIGAGALAIFFKTTGFAVTQMTEAQKREAIDNAVNNLVTQLRENPQDLLNRFHEQYAQGLANEHGDLANLNYMSGYLEAANNDDLLSIFNLK